MCRRKCTLLMRTVSDAKATKRKSESAIAHTTFLEMDTIFFGMPRQEGDESDQQILEVRGVLSSSP